MLSAGRFCLAIAFALMASSCVTPYTPWPEEAGGGMAEKFPPDDARLATLKTRFQALLDLKADRTAPAKMLEAQGLLIRALRESAGGLLLDSRATADAASALMDEIESFVGAKRN